MAHRRVGRSVDNSSIRRHYDHHSLKRIIRKMKRQQKLDKKLFEQQNRNMEYRLERDINQLKKKIIELNKHQTGSGIAHFYGNISSKFLSKYEESVRPEGTIVHKGFIPAGDHHPTYRFWNVSEKYFDRSLFIYSLSVRSVHVLQSGIYLIYAQIVYHDVTGRNAFGIYINEHNEHHGVAKCIAYKSKSIERHHYQYCNTMSILSLDKMAYIKIRSTYVHRVIVAEPSLTFWTVLKIT